MAVSTRTKKILKRAGLISAGIILVLTIVFEIISSRLEPVVGSFIKQSVQKSTAGLYIVDFNSLSITVASERVKFTGLHIHADMGVYKRMKQNGTAPALLYDITIPEFTVRWLSIYKAMFKHELDIHAIELENPEIVIRQFSKKSEKVFSKTQIDPYKIISGMFTSANVKKISIVDGNLSFDERPFKPQAFSLSNLNLLIGNIVIDSTTENDTSHFMKADNVTLSFKNLSYQTPDTLYRISMEQFDLSQEFSSSTKTSIGIKNIQLLPNQVLYAQMKSNGKTPAFLYSISIPIMDVDSLNLYKLFFKSTIQLGTVSINNPLISITENKVKLNTTKKDTAKTRGDLYEIINNIFASVKSKQINITEASIQFQGSDNQSASFLKLKNCDLQVTDVSIDSTTRQDTSRFLSSKGINLTLKQLSFLTSDSLYRLSIGKLTISTLNSSARVDSLKITPRYGKVAFMRKKGFKTTRVELIAPMVEFNHLNLPALLNEGRIYIGKVTSQNMNVQAYCDRRFTDQKKKAPTIQGLLLNLKKTLTVDTLQINNLNVGYEEFPPKGKASGHATFDNLYMTLTNITNDPLQLKKNSECIANIQGVLFAKGKMDAHLVFYLNDKKGKFTVKGSLGPMPAIAFNSMTVPIEDVKIGSGNIVRAEINFVADNHSSKGTVLALYNNFKLDFSNMPGISKIRETASNLVASAVVIPDNPLKEQPVRTMNTEYVRDSTDFILDYLWQSIFSGVKPLVFQKANSVKNTFDKLKSDIKAIKRKKDDKNKK